MRWSARVVLLLCLSSGLLAQNTGTIFVVRHAEKQSDAEDTPLSARGQTRAQCLARTLRDAGITTMIHSQYIRTTQTGASVVAQSHSKQVEIPAKDYEQIATAARTAAQSGNVLIVGHSNTVPGVITGLGGPSVQVPDAAYDLLFVVNVQDPKRVLTLHYCTELPSDTPAAGNTMAR